MITNWNKYTTLQIIPQVGKTTLASVSTIIRIEALQNIVKNKDNAFIITTIYGQKLQYKNCKMQLKRLINGNYETQYI